jgi:predicted phosphodiesterase
MRDETWAFLESLPACGRHSWAGRVVAVHHGSPESDTEFVSPYKPLPPSVETFWDDAEGGLLILGHTHIPMIVRGPRGTIVNPGSVLGVPGVQTSYSVAVLDTDTLAVRVLDIRTGREIRRDPVFLDDEQGEPGGP